MSKVVKKIEKDKRLTFVTICGECPYLKWELSIKEYPKKKYKCKKNNRKVDPLAMSDKCPFDEVKK